MKTFKQLFHLALHVSDLEKSIEFYGKLGMDHVFTLKLDDGRDWLAYVRIKENQYLELFPIYEDHPLTPRGPITHNPNDSLGHFSLLVEDIYYSACKWAEQGIRVVYAPFKPEAIPLEKDKFNPIVGADRDKICWVVDPDGNWIEVMEELEDSWQRVFEQNNPF